MRATLIIINHNGRHLLETSVPAAVAAARAGDHAVTVADDGSTDDSLAYVANTFPEVTFLAGPKRGFGPTCNRAVEEAHTEAAVLLNSDVVVAPDFLPPLLRHLEDTDTFAAGPKFLNPDGSLTRTLGNRTSGEWRGGVLYLHHETEAARLTEAGPQLYANGGAMAFRRDRWLELGGFDDLYHPFYWEDVDVGYRAWARGGRVVYDPASVVYHAQGQTIARLHGAAAVDTISARNAMLFTWKNLLDPGSFRRAALAQARSTADDVLIAPLPNRLRALLAAFRRLPAAARGRGREQRERMLDDAEILRRARGGAG